MRALRLASTGTVALTIARGCSQFPGFGAKMGFDSSCVDAFAWFLIPQFAAALCLYLGTLRRMHRHGVRIQDSVERRSYNNEAAIVRAAASGDIASESMVTSA